MHMVAGYANPLLESTSPDDLGFDYQTRTNRKSSLESEERKCEKETWTDSIRFDEMAFHL